MNANDFERIMKKIIDDYQKILSLLTKEEVEELFRIVTTTIANLESYTEQEFESLLLRIDSIYKRLKNKFNSFTIQTIPAIFNLTQQLNQDFLEKLFAYKQDYTRDMRAVSILVRDMLQDFNIACNNGQESIKTFFQISKQMQLAESDISRLVAEGVLDKGSTYGGKKLLRKVLKQEIIDRDSFNKYIKNKFTKEISLLKKKGYKGDDLLAEIEKLEQKIISQKYLQIIDKNGNVRSYSVKSYADLVVRTRLGEAQVISTIEFGLNNEIKYFQVTGHNTSTPVCKQHEYKIYTIDRNEKNYLYLTKERRPLYHPNCQHRLVPRVLL